MRWAHEKDDETTMNERTTTMGAEALEPARGPACLSDLALDRWQAGELEAPAIAAAEAHVGGCARCAGRLAAVRRIAAPAPRAIPSAVDSATAPRPVPSAAGTASTGDAASAKPPAAGAAIWPARPPGAAR